MNNDPVQFWPLLVVTGVLTSFILVGLFNKSREGGDYGFSGRYIGRIGGGASIASNWMSAASIMGIAGVLYLQGYMALAYVIGWTGGYVLLLVLLSGQLRRFGKHTAPDFVGDRYESSAARLISALISIVISIIYCVGQFKGIGMIFSWLFSMEYVKGVTMGALAVIAYVVFSGFLGVSRSQQLQYSVMIVSFILPLMVLARKMGYFWVIPQFGYGVAMDQLSSEYGINLAAPYSSTSFFQWAALCFTLMVGTAGLPHVLSKFYVVPNIRDAKWSLVWGLFFIALIYWSAPAYGVFARLLELQQHAVPDPETARRIADMVVIDTAIRGGLPPWLVGVLAAGALSAAFFSVAGVLITGAASISFDIYARIINRQASESSKMAVAKGAVVFLAVLVLLVAIKPPGLIVEIIAVAFALAGNTIFPVFLLGIWWGRANRQGAIAGMLFGTLVTFAEPLFGGVAPFISKLFPVTSSALFGTPLVIIVMIVVSLLTPPPSEEMRRFLAEEVHGHLE